MGSLKARCEWGFVHTDPHQVFWVSRDLSGNGDFPIISPVKNLVHSFEIQAFLQMDGGVAIRFHEYYLSHEKNHPTFYYTGWLIGILIVAYYNPYITG